LFGSLLTRSKYCCIEFKWKKTFTSAWLFSALPNDSMENPRAPVVQLMEPVCVVLVVGAFRQTQR